MLKKNVKDVLHTTSFFLGILSKHAIHTVADLLAYFPRAYEDRSQFSKLANVKIGESVQVIGTLNDITKLKTKNGYKLIKAKFIDEEGNEADIVWFNQQYLATNLKEDKKLVLSGKFKIENRKLECLSPKFEYISSSSGLVHFGKIVPIYPEMEKLSTDWIRKKITECKKYISEIPNALPQELMKEKNLMKKSDAVKELHFPTTTELLEKAKRTLAFEELFILQLKNLQRKMSFQKSSEQKGISIPMDAELIKEFLKILPFQLTDHQKIVIFQMLKDMEATFPMQRLLEGDVGSGKTVVATIVALHAIKKAGVQVAFMAPTEVLATQHFEGISELLKDFELNIMFLTGSIPKKQKKEIYEQITTGHVDIVIGTHALIQDNVDFLKLGLVIIDEQHRFGVAQREKLASHGFPHVLNMTATPIPRTLALTMYGDLDLSVIRQMPEGRKKIVTKIISPHKKQMMYDFIESEYGKGKQIFVICPLIEESEKLEDVKAVTKEFEYLKEHIFPNIPIALIHGKMTAEMKNEIMQDFHDKKYGILIATSVIEVGINVPNATVMVIEGAERFGLSQLHQLRGRVGRSTFQSYCFLSTEKSFPESLQRLKAMEEYHDGFSLAEIDLDLRGPGEVYGVRQSGIPDMKMANLSDIDLIVETRDEALKYLEEDLALSKYPELQKLL